VVYLPADGIQELEILVEIKSEQDMEALTFWKTVTMDTDNLLERLVAVLEAHQITYCVIGGQAVNAYVEPLVSLDLDLVVSVAQLNEVEALLAQHFSLRRFPHSLNISVPGSDLRVQVQTDPRYGTFPERATRRQVLGLTLPVADVADVLQGKIWAAMDEERRGSKRQKDLADIARLVEAYPDLRKMLPQEISRLLL
jgi:hypothetical protein